MDCPKQDYAAAFPLDLETLEKLVTINGSTGEGLLYDANLAIALYTGRRASKLVSRHWEHVKITGKRDRRVTLTFAHCKGNKVMRDLLDMETTHKLLDYLYTQYGKQIVLLPGDMHLWVSYSRQNPARLLVQKPSATFARSIGTPARFTRCATPSPSL